MSDTISRANAEVCASPIVRRLANRSGVALAGVDGTGTGGRITRADVEQAAGIPTPSPAAAARAAALAMAQAQDELYAAVFGPQPEPSLTADQAQLYASVYGQPAQV